MHRDEFNNIKIWYGRKNVNIIEYQITHFRIIIIIAKLPLIIVIDAEILYYWWKGWQDFHKNILALLSNVNSFHSFLYFRKRASFAHRGAKRGFPVSYYTYHSIIQSSLFLFFKCNIPIEKVFNFKYTQSLFVLRALVSINILRNGVL